LTCPVTGHGGRQRAHIDTKLTHSSGWIAAASDVDQVVFTVPRKVADHDFKRLPWASAIALVVAGLR